MIWIVNCPNCETENEVDVPATVVDCGEVSCKCTCINCQSEFEHREEYLRWLGLDEAPPEELMEA